MAREDDLSVLISLEARAGQRFAAVGMQHVADAEPEDMFAAQPLARDLVSEGSIWITTHDDVAVGMLGATEADGYGFILEIAVLAEHAGHKLAWRMIDTCEAWARAKRLRALTLATFRDVPWNRPYYAKMGFQDWPRERLSPAHERSWQAQSKVLDMSKRLFMIREIR